MPLHQSMSLGAPAGSSRRKRPFAEITRSESRSQSPELPSKRRRRISRSLSASDSVAPTASQSPFSTSPTPESRTPTLQIPATRSIGDGLDFRRPVMSAPNPPPQTIDLTFDEDSPNPPSPWSQTPVIPTPSPPPISDSSDYLEEPPIIDRQIEVIDLADSDVEADAAPSARRASTDIPLSRRRPPVRVSSSPDVEFVRENPIIPPPIHYAGPNLHERPRQPAYQTADRSIYNAIRDGAQHIFGQLVNLQPHRPTFRPPVNVPRVPEPQNDADGFAGLQFDYQQQGFAMGNRGSEAPQITSEPYKAPAAAKEGFTRGLEEEEILVCPYCGDELAAGEGDVKQQVWVVKNCGHVYCGTCATNRATITNKKAKRNDIHAKFISFKTCVVDGCNKSVTAKGAMVQIYL